MIRLVGVAPYTVEETLGRDEADDDMDELSGGVNAVSGERCEVKIHSTRRSSCGDRVFLIPIMGWDERVIDAWKFS